MLRRLPASEVLNDRTYGVLQLTLRLERVRLAVSPRCRLDVRGRRLSRCSQPRGAAGTGAGRERLLDDPQHARPLALGDRDEPAELEPSELDPPRGPDGAEPEVGEEVAREDGAVDEEALVGRLALRIAVGERLERLGALVARLADRGEEERLLDPRRRARDDVDARDEHRVVGRRPGGELGGAREELRVAVLDRAEQPPVVVAVERAPRAPVVLRLLDPAVLGGRAAGARLPPDAGLADGGREFERRAGQAYDALLPLVHDHVDGVGTNVGHAGEVLGDVGLHLGPDRARARAPVERDVQLDPDLAVLARDPHALVAVQRAADEAVDAGDLEGRVGGVAREHVGRDDGMAFHQVDSRRTSSVTSGRAKSRKGTNVVPRPGETCSVTPPSR